MHCVVRRQDLKGNKPVSVKQNYANKLPSGVSQSTLVLKPRVEEHQSLSSLKQLTDEFIPLSESRNMGKLKFKIHIWPARFSTKSF
jgi:hypothetical protein